MYQYVRIQSYTCSHTSTHSHMPAHTSCICTHTYKPTAARACTQNHTHSHTCTHTIICTYTVSTHTHKHKSHIRHAQPQTGAHTHTAYPGFGGLWSPLPVNPRVLGYLKVTGAYVQLITKPTGLGSGPRSRRGLSPSSLCSTHASREKEGLQGSYQGWKSVSTCPVLPIQGVQRRSTCFTELIRRQVWRRLESQGRGSQGLPSILGAPEEVGFRVSAAV